MGYCKAGENQIFIIPMGHSRAQKAQSHTNVSRMNSGDKENSKPFSGNFSDANNASKVPSVLRTKRVRALDPGMSTDHAKDQKKLFRLFEAWKVSYECEMRGEEALLSASLTEIIPLLWKETQKNIYESLNDNLKLVLLT